MHYDQDMYFDRYADDDDLYTWSASYVNDRMEEEREYKGMLKDLVKENEVKSEITNIDPVNELLPTDGLVDNSTKELLGQKKLKDLRKVENSNSLNEQKEVEVKKLDKTKKIVKAKLASVKSKVDGEMSGQSNIASKPKGTDVSPDGKHETTKRGGSRKITKGRKRTGGSEKGSGIAIYKRISSVFSEDNERKYSDLAKNLGGEASEDVHRLFKGNGENINERQIRKVLSTFGQKFLIRCMFLSNLLEAVFTGPSARKHYKAIRKINRRKLSKGTTKST